MHISGFLTSSSLFMFSHPVHLKEGLCILCFSKNMNMPSMSLS